MSQSIFRLEHPDLGTLEYPSKFLLLTGKNFIKKELTKLGKQDPKVELLEKMLQLPVQPVIEKNKIFLPGNGGKVKIFGKTQYVLIDGSPRLRQTPNNGGVIIVSADAPLAQKLLGKHAGYSGSYQPQLGTKKIPFEILKIDTPEHAKWGFKYYPDARLVVDYLGYLN